MNVCPQCLQGYCDACTQQVRGAAVCRQCDVLCVLASEYGRKQQVHQDRDRPLTADIGVILAYPARDQLGFVMLVLFTWFFKYLSGLLSGGVLLWYSFHALERVANGNMRDFTPDFSDISDLFQPSRLAFATMVIALAPLVAVWALTPLEPAFMVPPTAEIEGQQTPEALQEFLAEEGLLPEAEAADPNLTFDPEPARSPAWGLALLLAAGWGLIYTPVALTVAGLSRSVFSTLNPLVGLDTIRRMGSVYWQALLIYFGLVLVSGGIGSVLGLVPLAGGLLQAFVNAYAMLAVGCTLGLAVHKKAPELDWE